MYCNEKEVGEAVRASGLDRSEVFITSKLNNGFHRPDDARMAFDGTLEALGSDYVDLFPRCLRLRAALILYGSSSPIAL